MNKLKLLLLEWKKKNERTFLFSPELHEIYAILHEADSHYEWGPDTDFEQIYDRVKLSE
jgi:hypothetical protein